MGHEPHAVAEPAAVHVAQLGSHAGMKIYVLKFLILSERNQFKGENRNNIKVKQLQPKLSLV